MTELFASPRPCTASNPFQTGCAADHALLVRMELEDLLLDGARAHLQGNPVRGLCHAWREDSRKPHINEDHTVFQVAHKESRQGTSSTPEHCEMAGESPCADEAQHTHGLGLADAVDAVDGLLLRGGVPPRVQQDLRKSRLQDTLRSRNPTGVKKNTLKRLASPKCSRTQSSSCSKTPRRHWPAFREEVTAAAPRRPGGWRP